MRLRALDLRLHKLGRHRPLANLGLQPPDLGIPCVSRAALQRHRARGQELVAPAAQLGGVTPSACATSSKPPPRSRRSTASCLRHAGIRRRGSGAGPSPPAWGALRRAHARGPEEHSLQQHVDDFADAGHDGPPGAAFEAEPEADLDLTRSDDACRAIAPRKAAAGSARAAPKAGSALAAPFGPRFVPAVVASGRIGTMMISGPSDDIVAQTPASWLGATSRGILSDQPLSLAVSGKDGPDSRYGSGQRRSGATGTFMTLCRRRPARSGDWLACTFIPARIEARCPHWQPWSSQHRARSRRGHISARKSLSAAAGVDHARHLLCVPTLSPSAAALEPLAIADKLMGYVYAVAHRPPNAR